MELLRGPYRASTIDYWQTVLRSTPLTIAGIPQVTRRAAIRTHARTIPLDAQRAAVTLLTPVFQFQALLMTIDGGASMQLVAEQIAWTKARS